MKLQQREKGQLIASAQQVYMGYLALDFIKTKAIGSASRTGETVTLAALVRDSVANQEIFIAGQSYRIQGSGNKLTFSRSVIPNHAAAVKSLNEYTDEQVGDVLAQTTFVCDLLPNGELAFSVLLAGNKSIVIGGPGKVDLYRTHLITLLNIIQKIETEDNVTALLVALATGTGKTFVQALWMEVLYLSGFTGIFAVPDELIPQFIRDMNRLLPDTIVQNMKQLRRNTSSRCETAEAALSNLNTPGHLIVADAQSLIDNHYQALLTAPGSQTFLSVDEQHLLMQCERHRQRLLTLPSKLLSLFLTATPDEETFKLSGSNPVATMSNKQKQQAGQGRLPKFTTIETPFFSDLNRRNAKGWWSWIKNEAQIRLPNLLFPEISSAAQFAIERIPFHFHYEAEQPGQGHANLRWNLHMSMARKVLCVIEDNEALINFMNYIHRPSDTHIAGRPPTPLRYDQHRHRQPTVVYSEGGMNPNGLHAMILDMVDTATRVTRRFRGGDMTEFMPLWGTEELMVQERALTWQTASEQLPDEDTKAFLQPIVDAGMAAQLKLNMFHYLVEYVLSDLTDLDQIASNQLRKHNLQDLVNLVRRTYQPRSAGYYTDKLQLLIDQQGARQIGGLLASLSEYLDKVLHSPHSDELNLFVDNWFLDRTIMTNMNAHRNFTRNFEAYAKQHLVLAVMDGMGDADTPVDDGKPFRKFDEERYQAFDDNGRFTPQAKQRPRHSLQILIGMMGGAGAEELFKPAYMSIDEETADNYFRLGFVGVYASNKKQKGFSDLNLHTVVNIAEKTVSANNAPEITIQASGRNRGLDPTVVPAYIHVLGNRQITNFDPKLLEKDNYYSGFFKAQSQYHEQCIDLLGMDLAAQIHKIYFKHRVPGVEFKAATVHAEISQEIAVFLRNINNRNGHNISLSRAQLARVVAKAMTTLEQRIGQLRNPYSLSPAIILTANIGLSLSQAILYVLNFSQNRTIRTQLQQHEQALDTSEQAKRDRLYLKIVRQTTPQDLVSVALPSLELFSWAKKQVSPLHIALVAHLEKCGMSRLDVMQELNSIPDMGPFPPRDLLQLLSLVTISMQQEGGALSTQALLTEHFGPIIFNSLFIKTIRLLVGSFTEEDLVVLFSMAEHPDPASGAKRLLAFVEILETQNMARFVAEFLSAPNHDEPLPIMRLGSALMMIGQKVMLCNEYFNQATIKGAPSYYEAAEDEFLSQISRELLAIRKPYRQIESQTLVGKSFFASLSNLAKVVQESNSEDIRNLSQIKNHILRPTWWTTNLSKWSFAIVEGAKTLVFRIRDFGFALWNTLQQGVAWIRGTSARFRPSTKNKVSTDYNAATFEMMREMNTLTPLSEQDVVDRDCPKDGIVGLERSIAGRKDPRLFATRTSTEVDSRITSVPASVPMTR